MEKQKEQKTRGRKKNTNYLPWNEARDFIRKECLSSRIKYEEWYQKNKPDVVPRFPYRVYKEWTSWNDFLGTNNEFGKRVEKDWRSFNEAILWVHTLGLKTQEQWLEYVRETGIPEDIPARPDLVYKGEWKGWPYWTGKNIHEVITTKVAQEERYIYYIINERNRPGNPGNILTFGVERNGVSALRSRWDQNPFDILGLYWYDKEKEQQIKHLLNNLSSPYYEDERVRVVPNVNELLWYFDMILDRVRF